MCRSKRQNQIIKFICHDNKLKRVKIYVLRGENTLHGFWNQINLLARKQRSGRAHKTNQKD